MRFMVIVKSTPETESGQPPSTEMLEAMAKYNEELVRAGVMLDGNGLTSSADGALVQFADGVPTVTDGPFTEAKELVAGYWIFDVKSLDEAIEWIRRVPTDPDEESEIEIRRMYEGDEFGESLTDDIRKRLDRMSQKIAEQRG